MNHAVRFHRDAEAEFADAQAWYEVRGIGLGQEFVTCIQALVERVRRSPETFPLVDREVRRAVARRFPYSVLFLVEPELITVVAVFHSARSPGHWQSRLP